MPLYSLVTPQHPYPIANTHLDSRTANNQCPSPFSTTPNYTQPIPKRVNIVSPLDSAEHRQSQRWPINSCPHGVPHLHREHTYTRQHTDARYNMTKERRKERWEITKHISKIMSTLIRMPTLIYNALYSFLCELKWMPSSLILMAQPANAHRKPLLVLSSSLSCS
ncbi:hypothetical protein GOP47_0005831 [Adiantum capillus-veneris]|uniref:Uncharacterized protein n=1 Tax=Adiantum capillus-veneris TaxID=13818 RepID=A0A9D4V7G5_ADICA|nr:hypothetical protein GOP47_0005831 [Adiantum capillus-veneris]